MADPYKHFLVECEKKMRQIFAERLDEIRAAVGEEIAQAIEAEARRDKNGVSAWVYGWQDALNYAAKIARGHTQATDTGQDTADRKESK